MKKIPIYERDYLTLSTFINIEKKGKNRGRYGRVIKLVNRI
jgi:hypothetical protein